MVPITRRDEANNRMAQVGNAPPLEGQPYDGNRQPQMSEPNPRLREQGIETDHWLVPDTRDDIVVSRVTDY
jgi:hypothetical protein